eukprot:2558368-Amphidinium_carterae.1
MTELVVASRFDNLRSGMRTPVYPAINFDELADVPDDEDALQDECEADESRVRERDEVSQEERQSKTARTSVAGESSRGAVVGSAASSGDHDVCLWEYIGPEQTMIGFLPPDGWDGSDTLLSAHAGKHAGAPSCFLDSSDDRAAADDLSRSGWASQQNAADAASVKALQKELPWEFIVRQPQSFVTAFHDALRKE